MQRLLAFTLLGSAAAFQPDDRDALKAAVDACSGAMTDCEAADGTHITVWDVSGVTDMNMLFANNAEANPDLSAWDVGQVTKMNGMFFSASAFDGDLSAWDVGQVTHMGGMFDGASVFNGDLSAWDVGRVIYMNGMFWKASAFDQDLSAWNVEQVINMALMFKDASAFNQQLCGPTWVDSTAHGKTTMFTGSSGSIAACDLCPAGEFNNAGTCAPCQVATEQTEGTYSARAGQTICLACPAFTISDTIGCSSCNPGMFVNGDSCFNCEAGTYRSATDSAQECVGCPAGKYGTEEGKESEGDGCSECPNGWSTFDDAAVVCDPSHSTHTQLLADASENCQTVCPDSCAGASADVLVNAILNNPTAYQQAGLCT